MITPRSRRRSTGLHSAFDRQTRWRGGPRTVAWDQLWRRILAEALLPQHAPVTVPTKEQTDD